MVHPKISIVTPSFNQATMLEHTIRSVLDQGYPNLEYIVIDAGSTDGSVDIIRKYADRLAYWISEPDRGHADGINKGFAHATGEIMAWINSSDGYYPWTLATVARVFRDVPEAQWISGLASYFSEGLYPVSVEHATRNMYDFLSGDYAWLQQESIFWRRTLWESTGGHLDIDVKLACDFELWLRFIRQAPIYNVKTILGGFRYHDDGRAKAQRTRYEAEAAEHFADFYKSSTLRERLRARLVATTNNPVGRVGRSTLRRLGGMKWYVHPRIAYDFDNHRWEVI
jgi:glycosyltransferase involved in cell wall biosynthesis